MRVIGSIAVSEDGFIDDASSKRLVLSDEADWTQVRELRSECDAILVGAETIRRDNPSLKGVPVKVILSGSGNIAVDARVFQSGEVIVITGAQTARSICHNLEQRGISRLLVEGGARTMEMFLEEDCIDEFRMAVAPVKIKTGVKFSGQRIISGQCRSIGKVGQMTVSEYIVHPDKELVYLQQAINLSRRTPLSPTAYSVGAVIVTADGRRFEGYTHQTGPHNHAEEEAINAALNAGAGIVGATIYSSMEPCSERSSKSVPCSQLIINQRFARVVYAAAEPECFVCCQGAEQLRRAGIMVRQIRSLAPQVLNINRHILG